MSFLQLRNHLSSHPDPECAAVWPVAAAAPTLPQLWLRHWEDEGIPVYQRAHGFVCDQTGPRRKHTGQPAMLTFPSFLGYVLQEGGLHDEGIQHKCGSPFCLGQ